MKKLVAIFFSFIYLSALCYNAFTAGNKAFYTVTGSGEASVKNCPASAFAYSQLHTSHGLAKVSTTHKSFRAGFAGGSTLFKPANSGSQSLVLSNAYAANGLLIAPHVHNTPLYIQNCVYLI